MTKKLLTINDIENILLKNISQKYNIDYNELLLELNLILSAPKAPIERRKYFCDDDFFSIDNEKSFYWSGFFAADGCSFKKKGENSKTIILALSQKDHSHLEMFKSDIKFTGPISQTIIKHSLENPKWNDSIRSTVRITSSELFDNLLRFNIVQRKTHIYKMPDWLLIHPLLNHFIRGYFDGDGCITFNKNSTSAITKEKAEINFRGTMDFLWQIKNIFERDVQLKSVAKPRFDNGTGILKFSGNRICSEIKDYLYKDAITLMQRKYDLCQSIKVIREKYSNRL